MMKMTKCKNCGNLFSRNLTHCPNCGTRTPAASTFITIAFTVGTMLLIFVIILLTFFDDTPSEAGYSPQQVENKTEIHYIEVTADDIFSAFEDNEVAAEERFKGQLVKITGIVDDINSQSVLTSANILLKSDGMGFSCVQCNFNSENSKALAAVKKGESITIIGTCEGKSFLNVIINACELQ